MRLRPVIAAMFVGAVVAASAADVPESLKTPFEGRTITPIEGVWAWTDGGMVSIVAASDGTLTLTLVDSPDPLVDTPMEMGTGRVGGAPGTYDLTLRTLDVTKKGVPVTGYERFRATVTSGDAGTRLELTPVKTGLKVRLGRLLPYLVPVSVSMQTPPDGTDGAIRVYPDTGSPDHPVVL